MKASEGHRQVRPCRGQQPAVFLSNCVVRNFFDFQATFLQLPGHCHAESPSFSGGVAAPSSDQLPLSSFNHSSPENKNTPTRKARELIFQFLSSLFIGVSCFRRFKNFLSHINLLRENHHRDPGSLSKYGSMEPKYYIVGWTPFIIL